jgi:IS30 family transposase
MTNLETSSTPEVKEKTQTQLMKEQIENTLDQVAQLAENGEWEIDTTVDTNV